MGYLLLLYHGLPHVTAIEDIKVELAPMVWEERWLNNIYY